MRHRRDYADVSNATEGWNRPSDYGFLGVPTIGSGVARLVKGFFGRFRTIFWPPLG